eukprot:366063-Chlamydomonas_euryale.AAC.7
MRRANVERCVLGGGAYDVLLLVCTANRCCRGSQGVRPALICPSAGVAVDGCEFCLWYVLAHEWCRGANKKV